MATSGSNYYSPDGGTLRLVLNWRRTETDVANNRSKIRLTLQLTHGGTGVWFSARKSGSLHGQSFTYSGGFSNTGTVTLRTRDVWINHNSDGTKTQRFDARFDIAITYRGRWLGSMSTSVTANIDRIPRSSTINSFSIANNLRPNTSNSVRLSLSRATTGFTHDIELRDGSTVLQRWSNQGVPTSLSLSSGVVNTLLGRMSSVTSRQLTLRVVTKSGSSTIGTTTRNATATVDSSVTPAASGLSISQVGNDVTSHYLQSISRISASFSASATGGASLASTSISVSRGSDKQTIDGTSGTTRQTIQQSGLYEVVAAATDSRGRTATQRITFTATAYLPPRISTFSLNRDSDNQALVRGRLDGSHTSLSGLNTLSIRIERQARGTTLWSSVYNTTHSTNSFSYSPTISGNNVANSYEFRLTVRDSFGNSAESRQSVATQRVVLDIHKNEGVGIGKVRENGVLDVDGDIFIGGAQNRINTTDPNGHFNITAGNQDLYLRGSRIILTSSNILAWEGSGSSTELVESGSNANGNWVKFYDGTMICHTTLRVTRNGLWSAVDTWTFPIMYPHYNPVVQGTFNNAFNQTNLGELEHAEIYISVYLNRAVVRLKPTTPNRFEDTSLEARVDLLAVGRWK